MYGSLDISTSGLIANRVRLDVISANIAGKDTILNAQGQYEPFRRRIALFAAGTPNGESPLGVHVAAIELDPSELSMRFEPDSPYANADGYVGYPNVNMIMEQMNAMEAARSYEANIAAIEATKSMISIALQSLA
jgi:flagellar basal-body rod protein FlgC